MAAVSVTCFPRITPHTDSASLVSLIPAGRLSPGLADRTGGIRKGHGAAAFPPGNGPGIRKGLAGPKGASSGQLAARGAVVLRPGSRASVAGVGCTGTVPGHWARPAGRTGSAAGNELGRAVTHRPNSAATATAAAAAGRDWATGRVAMAGPSHGASWDNADTVTLFKGDATGERFC